MVVTQVWDDSYLCFQHKLLLTSLRKMADISQVNESESHESQFKADSQAVGGIVEIFTIKWHGD